MTHRHFTSQLFAGLLLSVLCGCSIVPAVPDAGTDELGTFTTSCRKPYVLTQYCSPLTFGNFRIDLDGHELKLATNDDGTVIGFTEVHDWSHFIVTPFDARKTARRSTKATTPSAEC